MSEMMMVCPKAVDGTCKYNPKDCNHGGIHPRNDHYSGRTGHRNYCVSDCMPSSSLYAKEELFVCDHWKTCRAEVWCKRPFRDDGFKVKYISTAQCGFHGETLIKTKAIPYTESTKETPMKQYDLLKPITIKALIQAQGDVSCESFWKDLQDFLSYLNERDYGDLSDLCVEWRSTVILKYISDKPRIAEWLAQKGFIKKREPEKTYKRGDEFKIDGTHKCMLSFIGSGQMVLIATSPVFNDKGNFWSSPKSVKDQKAVTNQEMLTLTDGKGFELISE